MKQSTKDRADGAMHEVKGKIKKNVGHMMNNPDKEDEGADEELAGKIEKGVGKIEKKVGM